jgi:hypothetical protein
MPVEAREMTAVFRQILRFIDELYIKCLGKN